MLLLINKKEIEFSLFNILNAKMRNKNLTLDI
jgi:hypothetical protein